MTAALLIVDVQTALCQGRYETHDRAATVDRINAVSAAWRTAGRPVVLVQHEEPGGEFARGGPDWQLWRELLIAPEDLRSGKTVRNAFAGTALHAQLQALGVDSVVVCGMQSEFCVNSTARGALALGYAVTVVADGHTTLDADGRTAGEITAGINAGLAELSGVRLAEAAALAH